jgi:HAD superfamily hydrolase (TIGR01509 family)
MKCAWLDCLEPVDGCDGIDWSRDHAASSNSSCMLTAMSSVISAVIFDMDGLMIDTERPVQLCCREAASRLGFDLEAAFYDRELVGRGWVECDAALAAYFGPDFSLDRFHATFGDLWAAHIATHGVAIKPGLIDLLNVLDERQIVKAVATSTHRDEAEKHLRVAGLSAHFPILVTGDEVARGKPEPDIYLEAARRVAVPPSECLALEDSNAGVLAASRAGMVTLMVPDAPRIPSSEARDAAAMVLDSLFEVIPFVSEGGRLCPRR